MENIRNLAQFLIVGSILGTVVMGYPNPNPQANEDGSMCPNTFCSPPLPGAQCTPKYEREDGCCPVWYCNLNGAFSQIYGKSTGSSSGSSWSSSSSDGGMPMNFGGGGGQGFSSFSSSSSNGFPNSGGGGFNSFSSNSFGNPGRGGGGGGFPGLSLQLPSFGNLFGRR